MHTSGRKGGYAFHLSKADVSLYFSVRKNWMATPNVWVDIGSSSCWMPSWHHVVGLVNDVVEHFNGRIHKSGLSEAHLCVDFIGIAAGSIDCLKNEDCWITRANKFHAYSERSVFSGIELFQDEGRLGISDKPFDLVGSNDRKVVESGLRVGKGDIMLRVYDKVLEMKGNDAKHSLFSSVWDEALQQLRKESYQDQPVTRVEFQIRRPVLRQLGVDTLSQLMEKLGGVWEYCVQRWAVLCEEVPDRENRHQDRAKVHEFWRAVQSVDWASYQPVERKRPLPLKDKHQNVDQMGGCLLNAVAIERSDFDDEAIIRTAKQLLADWLEAKSQEIDPDTGQSALLAKYSRKHGEIWPHGEAEVHGR